MFSVYSNAGKITYGQKVWVADSENDIATMPTNGQAGDLVFCIETSQYYMLNHSKTWCEVELGSSSPFDENATFLYDGGQA